VGPLSILPQSFADPLQTWSPSLFLHSVQRDARPLTYFVSRNQRSVHVTRCQWSGLEEFGSAFGKVERGKETNSSPTESRQEFVFMCGGFRQTINSAVYYYSSSWAPTCSFAFFMVQLSLITHLYCFHQLRLNYRHHQNTLPCLPRLIYLDLEC
jgi:hypothetical protein